jgi:hypothetical protein
VLKLPVEHPDLSKELSSSHYFPKASKKNAFFLINKTSLFFLNIFEFSRIVDYF